SRPRNRAAFLFLFLGEFKWNSKPQAKNLFKWLRHPYFLKMRLGRFLSKVLKKSHKQAYSLPEWYAPKYFSSFLP
ncbi:MAG: hypothetical protein MRZ46_06860, partial [Oscillospiraceae bacterium]|nr:hypothetical protein [Oscillospiraceae bacterium]